MPNNDWLSLLAEPFLKAKDQITRFHLGSGQILEGFPRTSQ